MSDASVIFRTDGAGRWWRLVWDPPCHESVHFLGRCQAPAGHAGEHWCYGPRGDYQVTYRADDPRRRGPLGVAGTSTPPGHPNYVHPAEKAGQSYLDWLTETEVTDSAELAELEAGYRKEQAE